MSIKLGNTTINKLYLGNTEIKKAYLGSALVYDKTASYPLTNIISEWKMENNVIDSVGTNNGVATNITYATSGVGQSAIFNGTTSKVVIADSDDLSFTSIPFSISCMIKFTSITNTYIINKRENLTNGNEYQLGYDITNGFFITLIDEFGGGVGYINKFYPFTPTLGKWYHLISTHNGGVLNTDLTLYLNGVSVGIVGGANIFTGMSNTDSAVFLGTNGWSELNDLDGSLDAVRIWDKELNATESLTIATDELAGIDINP